MDPTSDRVFESFVPTASRIERLFSKWCYLLAILFGVAWLAKSKADDPSGFGFFILVPMFLYEISHYYTNSANDEKIKAECKENCAKFIRSGNTLQDMGKGMTDAQRDALPAAVEGQEQRKSEPLLVAAKSTTEIKTTSRSGVQLILGLISVAASVGFAMWLMKIEEEARRERERQQFQLAATAAVAEGAVGLAKALGF
jgi:hypothetical protein